MDLPTELHLRIMEELLLDESLLREVHLHHYADSKGPYEKSLFRKVRHYDLSELDPAKGRQSYMTSTKTPYHPLLLTCRTLSYAFSTIHREQSLHIVHHHPFSRGVDDPGPYGPRRRVPLDALEQIRRVKVVAEYNRKEFNMIYSEVFATFSLYGPAYRARFPRVYEIRFEIQMIDWKLQYISEFWQPPPSPVPTLNVSELTITVRSIVRAYPRTPVESLIDVVLQFPSLTKLHVDWILLPPALRPPWTQDPEPRLRRVAEELRKQCREVSFEARSDDITVVPARR
jgi:hypothetical protein